jgi:hypothetical protein
MSSTPRSAEERWLNPTTGNLQSAEERWRKPGTVKISSFIDKLKEIDAEITLKLKSYDVFDLQGFPKRLKDKVIEVIEKRNLKFVDSGDEAMVGEVPTCFLVVGLKGADFTAHEAER